jgi:hypothetical protein
MDNFYNSFNLSLRMLEEKIYICGTLRDRRHGPEKLNVIEKSVQDGNRNFFKAGCRSYGLE